MFTDYTTARRLEAADGAGTADCVEVLGSRCPELAATVRSIAGGYALFAGVDSPVTQAVGLGMSGPVSAAELDEVEHFFKSRNAILQIELCPLADASLLKLISDRPYRFGEFSNVLARSISDRDSVDPVDPALRVQKVSSDEAGLWARTVVGGFFNSEELPQEFIDIVEASFYCAASTCILITIDGQPAGGGTVAVYDKVATLYGQSTLESYRHRGVQTAVIRQSLMIAQQSDCDLATICTEPGSTSQRNAQRHGFRVCYSRTKVLLREA